MSEFEKRFYEAPEIKDIDSALLYKGADDAAGGEFISKATGGEEPGDFDFEF